MSVNRKYFVMTKDNCQINNGICSIDLPLDFVNSNNPNKQIIWESDKINTDKINSTESIKIREIDRLILSKNKGRKTRKISEISIFRVSLISHIKT